MPVYVRFGYEALDLLSLSVTAVTQTMTSLPRRAELPSGQTTNNFYGENTFPEYQQLSITIINGAAL